MGCGVSTVTEPAEPIRAWESVEDLPQDLAIFERVFWEPRDTISLRKWIRESGEVSGKSVLEIGTGSGLLALCALQAGAARAVATDVNSNAIENARFNALRIGFQDQLDVRLVNTSKREAYSVIQSDEKFGLILSNPPWVDNIPARIEEFAWYDERFLLIESLLAGLKDRLEPGGKAMLAYGSVEGVLAVLRLSEQNGLTARILDERKLEDLDAEFLPGMLIEVRTD